MKAGARRAIVGGRVNAIERAVTHRRFGQLHHLQQHGFAGIDQFVQCDARGRAVALRAPSRASSGTWTNAARRGPFRCTRLDRAPAQVIAEIAAGIARDSRIDAGAFGRAQQFGGVRTEHHGVGAAGDRSLACPVRSASGHRVVTALRARVSIRTCAVRVARPNISSACGRYFASNSGNSRSTACRSRERCGQTVRRHRARDGAAAAAAPPAAASG